MVLEAADKEANWCQKYGRTSQKQRNERKNESGLVETPKVDNAGRLFTSLSQRMRRSRKLVKKTRGESWKFRCHQQCLARSGKERTRQLIAILIFPRQNTQLKPTSLGESVYNEFHTKIMKTILQEKETIHYSITIRFTNLFLCLKL